MRKKFSILLLVSLVLSLTACGGEEKKESGSGVDDLVSKYGFQWTDTSAPILNDEGGGRRSPSTFILLKTHLR